MADVAVSGRVVARNALGRFISKCEMAGHDTVEQLVKDGAKMSRRLAPEGSKHDLRSIPIKQSIVTRMIGRTAGVWESLSAHALHQEYGTSPHTMVGNPYFRFYWESAGRMWIPGLLGEQDIINHPGHDAQPFLRPAYAAIMARAMSVAKSKYPG